MEKSTILMAIFHSDVNLPDKSHKIPLNPIKPPFPYGFPMVRCGRGAETSAAPLPAEVWAEEPPAPRRGRVAAAPGGLAAVSRNKGGLSHENLGFLVFFSDV